MNRFTASLIGTLALSAAACGCASGTTGGPGAPQETGRAPLIGQADDTFQLGSSDTTIRQGEIKTISIPIERSRNFDQDVTIEISDLPRGLSIEMDDRVIQSGESAAELRLRADEDASLGQFTVKVVGRPTNGADATNQIEITVTDESND